MAAIMFSSETYNHFSARASNGRELMKKNKKESAANGDAETPAVELEANKAKKNRSGKEANRKRKRVTVPAEQMSLLQERLGMTTADCEGKTMNKQLLTAGQVKDLQRVNLCGAEAAAMWRERSAMRAADMETYAQERFVVAKKLHASEKRSECLAKRLNWHENLRDTVQSLARGELLQQQGLPNWIILEGKKLK